MIRALTEKEKDLARQVFGDALNCEAVRILASPFPRAFVPGRWFGREWVVWPRRALFEDLSAAPLNVQAILVHELVHVWQAQQGVSLLLAKLKAGDKPETYVYPIGDDCRWDVLNIEQQASLVEHAFRLSRGRTAPAKAAFYRSIAPFPVCGFGRGDGLLDA